MTDDFAAIKKRHSNIPQDMLPLDFGDDEHDGEPVKRSSVKSIRFAMCTACAKTTPTGVVLTHDGREVFREHNKVLASGRRIRCAGSGQEAQQ